MNRYTKVGLTVILLAFLSTSLHAQEQTITGTVIDGNTQEPLPGVNIAIQGTSTGTATGADGQYKLEVPAEADSLLFSFIGYESQAIAIQGRSTINVELIPQTYQGDELVVVGYGEQSSKTLTSSISSVSGEDIAKVPAANVGNTLFGTSGLLMEQRSGQPGADQPAVFIRGVGSLSSSRSEPLYVLDGVVMRDARSIMQLDPDNIESVSVLKDASSTAVYGVEGANGVIVVQTKRGRTGDMNISVNTSSGFQMPTLKQEFVDSYTYALGFNEAQITDGVSPNQVRFTPEIVEAFRTGSHPIIYPSVDWVDYFTKPRAFQNRTNISVSGGTDDIRYFVAGGYLKQDGFFDIPNDAEGVSYETNPTYDRYNLQSNLDIDITPSTLLSVNTTGRVGSRIDIPPFNNYWRNIYWAAPYSSPGIIDGKKVLTGNRYISGNKSHALNQNYGRGYNQFIENTLNMQLTVRQQLNQIINGLQLQVKGAYNVSYNQNKDFSMNIPIYEAFFRTDVDPSAPGDSTIVYRKDGEIQPLSYGESYGKNRDWYAEARLQYNRDFGSHSVEGLLLYGQRKRYYPSQYTGIPRGLINSVSRVNYNFDERYLLELSMGYNGSENFAEGNRFGFFPAISGGWILTNEPYMPELSFLNFLKLRASYGIVGNDTGIGRFLYLPDEYNASAEGYNFGYTVPQNQPGASEGALGNPGVTWEKARKQNYGVDMRLFADRLDISFDYFYEFRDGILINLNTVPSYVAADLPAVNLGQVENRGYEVEVTWRQQAGDFFYSVSGNVSHAKNKIIEMDEVPRNEPYQRRTGQPAGQPFGYVFEGYYDTDDFEPGTLDENLRGGLLREEMPNPTWTVHPGFLKYKDLNGDGIIDQEDQAPIGYPENNPEYSFKAALNLQYKNVDLSMSWVAVTNFSEDLFQVPGRAPMGAAGGRSMHQFQYDGRWTPDKDPDNILFPRLSLNAGGDRNSNDSDYWFVDASYIRLKSIEIGYTFNRLLTSIGIQNFRVYANAYNPLTFSNMMSNYSRDPEQTGAREGDYPIMKVYNFGLQIDF